MNGSGRLRAATSRSGSLGARGDLAPVGFGLAVKTASRVPTVSLRSGSGAEDRSFAEHAAAEPEIRLCGRELRSEHVAHRRLQDSNRVLHPRRSAIPRGIAGTPIWRWPSHSRNRPGPDRFDWRLAPHQPQVPAALVAAAGIGWLWGAEHRSLRIQAVNPIINVCQRF